MCTESCKPKGKPKPIKGSSAKLTVIWNVKKCHCWKTRMLIPNVKWRRPGVSLPAVPYLKELAYCKRSGCSLSFGGISSPCERPLAINRVFDIHSGFSLVVLSSRRSKCAPRRVSDVVSFQSSSLCSHSETQWDTEIVRECVCVCCLSVHVLRVSTALLSTVLVSYKSVVSFVWLVFLSPRLFSHDFSLFCSLFYFFFFFPLLWHVSLLLLFPPAL